MPTLFLPPFPLIQTARKATLATLPRTADWISNHLRIVSRTPAISPATDLIVAPGSNPITTPGTKVREQDFRHSRRRDFDADSYQTQPRAFGTRPRFNRAPVEAPSGPPVSGVVKWFSPDKGFGFVELSDGSGDAFLHGSVLTQGGIATIQPGETLEVRVGPGHKGPHVTKVLSVDSSTATPMTSRCQGRLNPDPLSSISPIGS